MTAARKADSTVISTVTKMAERKVEMKAEGTAA